MKEILVIGNGGREHALAWKIAQSPLVSFVHVAPGNGGTEREAKCCNVSIEAHDIVGLIHYVQEHAITYTVVGPDAPLAAGIVDAFTAQGLKIFGPTKNAAQLEWSKAFTKDFLARYHIPTARYRVCTTYEEAEAYIRAEGAPIVVKADGLAAGKGVVVARTITEACDFARECLLGGRFGISGARVVIEEFMEGEEASFTAIVSGTDIVPLATSQDHKRVFNHDDGPNTGGMGTYSPAPIVSDAVFERVMNEIITPTVRGMQEEGNPFVGFLYCGLMMQNGIPRVVEYNARFGDPETQSILMRLTSDIVPVLEHAINGTLSEQREVLAYTEAALCVVMASGGYPDTYDTGVSIHGIENAEVLPGVKVFHAGTVYKNDTLVSNGGRVLGVTARGSTIHDARKRAYEAVSKIHFDGAHYRTDIGWRAIL